jgi:hypothetical protein
MLNSRFIVASTAILLTVCTCLSFAQDVSETDLRDDWTRQEQLLGREPGDLESLRIQVERVEQLTFLLSPDPIDPEILKQTASMRDEYESLTGSGSPEQRTDLYFRMRELARHLAFTNPALDFDEILFVRRHWPTIAHQCSHRVGEHQQLGADIRILSGYSDSEPTKVRSVLEDVLPPGGIGRPDLSHDATQIIFPYAAPRETPTPYGYGAPGARGGACHMYDLFEIGLDGCNLKQLTALRDSEDTEPCYMPDGRIAFTSSRKNRLVQCGDWALVFGVHIMNADGAGVRSITEEQETEFYPTMLSDGRILYTRWDYVMKAYNVIQQLWSVNPDGTRPQLVYGDHFEFADGPLAFQEARPIPGTSRLLTIGAAHHNSGVGPLMIVDMAKNRGGPDGMINFTPEVGYPEATTPNTASEGGWYSSPYPLSEHMFLVSFSFERSHNADVYGLYLMDAFGGKELIYRDPEMSCYSPIPIRTRPLERIVPDMIDAPEGTPGVMVMADVYQGLEGVERGTVKYLRVCEVYPKLIHTLPQRVDVGAGSGWDIRGVLGTVPVEPDGSAHFEVPSGRMLFFEALDENYLEIRRMRNYVNVMPGERASCVGCHESYQTAASGRASGDLEALRRGPSPITPPPWGGTGQGFSFEQYVQPVLDQQCVSCHDGIDDEGQSFDLNGGTYVTAPHAGDSDAGPGRQHAVSTSFVNLLPYVEYVRVTGYNGPRTPLDPFAVGSGASELMDILNEGKHYDIELSLSEWRTLAAWIDVNAQFIGDWTDIKHSETPEGMAILSSNMQEYIKRRREDLAGQAQRDQATLLAYIDCGSAVSDGKKDAPRIVLSRGTPYTYYPGEKPAASYMSRIFFDKQRIDFKLENLDPAKSYRIGFTWWDYNAADREQKVVSVRGDGSELELLGSTLLPNWTTNVQLPESQRIDLPSELLTDSGVLNISFQLTGGANAVLSEFWLEEME